MLILKSILAFSCLFEITFASLKNCSSLHAKPAICFKNETGYTMPFPAALGVEVHFKDIIEIDEQMNSIRIKMSLWTYWTDPGLGLSNGEIEG